MCSNIFCFNRCPLSYIPPEHGGMELSHQACKYEFRVKFSISQLRFFSSPLFFVHVLRILSKLKTTAVRSRIWSRVIFASCVRQHPVPVPLGKSQSTYVPVNHTRESRQLVLQYVLHTYLATCTIPRYVFLVILFLCCRRVHPLLNKRWEEGTKGSRREKLPEACATYGVTRTTAVPGM